MRYVGGKSRLAKSIVSHFQFTTTTQNYVEPFVGSGAVVEQIQGRPRIANDAHPYLIALHLAVSDGWQPPTDISEDEYRAMQQNPDEWPAELVGFVGFACSFGAKWFGGYARGAGRNYAAESHNNLVKQAPRLRDVDWQCGDYREMDIPPNSLIYCDPPYKGTQGYAEGAFDSTAFWDWCLEQAGNGHTVYVSEYAAPSGTRSVWSKERAASLDKDTGGKRSVEHLFRVS
jgi:DNA adenine methylase